MSRESMRLALVVVLSLCQLCWGINESCERLSGMVCYLSKKDHCHDNWVLACAESRKAPEGSIALGCRVYNNKDVVIEYTAGQEPQVAGYMEPDLLYFLYTTKSFRSVRINVYVRVVGKYMTKGLQFPDKIFEFNALKTENVDEYVGLRAKFNDIRAFYRRYDNKGVGSGLTMMEMLVCRDEWCKRYFKLTDPKLNNVGTLKLFYQPSSPMSTEYSCRQNSVHYDCGSKDDCCNVDKPKVLEALQQTEKWDKYCAGCLFKSSFLLTISMVLIALVPILV